MRGSLAILFFFALGLLYGYALEPEWLLEHDPSVPALWLLMALVGFSLGADGNLARMLATLKPRLLLLPAATTIGTFAGACGASLVLSWPLFQCLATGSGFAYYSLSSVFITRFLGPDPGAAALICNILREIFTLLAVPILARYCGPLAAISSGGATTMDTTLPIIVRYAGSEWTMAAIIHAMVLDISVPFWVTLFCSLQIALPVSP